MFENCTRLVSMTDMFSANESFEEVSTGNIKYFLLPALLGSLTLKICGTNDRMHVIQVAEIYYIDFLKRLKSYGIIDVEIPERKDGEDDNVVGKPMSNTELITSMVRKKSLVCFFHKKIIYPSIVLRFSQRYRRETQNCRDTRNGRNWRAV